MEDDLFDDWDETPEGVGIPEIKPGEAYQTYEGYKACVGYFTENPLVFIGHVCEPTGVTAVQWDADGKADYNLYDNSYDIISPWSEPAKYVRYVYVYRENGEVRTKVTDTPVKAPDNLMACKKLVLTEITQLR